MSRNIRNAVNHGAVDYDYMEEIRVVGEEQIKTGDRLRMMSATKLVVLTVICISFSLMGFVFDSGLAFIASAAALVGASTDLDKTKEE